MARLRFVSDVEGASSIDLIERTITVGRDEENTVSIADPGISKHHALLLREGHAHKLFDLHSANGTWVNGERITTAKLNDGDLVRFGHLELQYETTAKKTTGGVKKIGLATGTSTPTVTSAGPPPPPPKRPGLAGQPPAPTLKAELKPGETAPPPLKKLASPSEQPVIAPKKLAAHSDQPTGAPKRLASEPPTDSPRIRLKRD
jgi:pSer/pThr/pTyr-binding forkhead associated (FHA) protein